MSSYVTIQGCQFFNTSSSPELQRNHPKREIVRETLGEAHMTKYGYESKRLHALFYKVMEGYECPGEEETLCGIMEQIEDLLDACYFLGINPLRELRHMLPQYSWKFLSLKDRSLTTKTIANSDFIWRVNWLEDMSESYSEKIELVTATKTSRSKHFKLFFAGQKKKLEQSTRELDFVRALGGDPVYSELLDEEWMKTPEGQKWLHTPIKNLRHEAGADRKCSQRVPLP